MKNKLIKIEVEFPESMQGQRFDVALSSFVTEYSRAVLQTWIDAGYVTVLGQRVKRKQKVQGGEQVVIVAQISEEVSWQAQDLPLDIIYSDEFIIVLNKPVNLVIHPAPGNRDGTLANALLYHYPELAQIPRAGIVHRLDKDTTGLMVIARNLQAHHSLVDQLQSRAIKREYLALVQGEVIAGDEIKTSFGRHPKNRLKMAVVKTGKEAITQYRIEKKYRGYTLLRINLKTGRTHQIRVHMQYLGYPLVGDKVYGEPKRLAKGLAAEVREKVLNFPRQALHATKLGLIHPQTKEPMSWSCALSEDITLLINVLDN